MLFRLLLLFLYRFDNQMDDSSEIFGSFEIGFPASINTLLPIKKNPRRNNRKPVIISSHSILTKSDKGPNTSIPSGIIEVAIIPNTPKTLPRKSPSTFSCSKTVEKKVICLIC